MPKVQLGECEIHYEEAGSGEPLLLLPGALGTGGSDFPEQIAYFSKSYRVIAPDMRGYGQSRPPARDFPDGFYGRDAEDMAGLMEALGHERFAVLGWSDGANAGTLMAIDFPERVTSLVVWGGNSFLSAEELAAFQSMRSLTTWSERAIEPLRAVYGDELQAVWEAYVVGLEALYAAGGDIYRERLEDVSCATLILHGDLDPLVPVHHPETIHRGIAGSELHRFAEGKHNIHKRYAAEFNELVSSFLMRTSLNKESH
jgi:valacyclovir hydrolase